jgi:anti-sigma factor RsiW
MKDTDMSPRTETDPALDPDLHAYVDGKLSPERAAEIEDRLTADPAQREAVAAWIRDRDLIREAASGDHPPDLRTELLGRELAKRVRARRFRTGLMQPALKQVAASVLIFATGWAGHALYVPGGAGFGPTEPRYVVQATLLGTALADRGVQDLDVSDARWQASLDWVSEQMQRKIEGPKLEQLGLQVVGGRLVDGEDGPLAQFTYQTEDDREIIVSMTPHPDTEPSYAYAVRSVYGQPVAYWTRDGMDFSITGETDMARLATLASALR